MAKKKNTITAEEFDRRFDDREALRLRISWCTNDSTVLTANAIQAGTRGPFILLTDFLPHNPGVATG